MARSVKLKAWPPAIIWYTDRIKGDWSASSNSFVVRIRPRFRHDDGLLRHELEHVRQWWMLPMLHSVLYMLVPRYRLWAEVRAYQTQLRAWPAKDDYYRYLDHFSEMLANRYRLRISVDEVRGRLRLADSD